MDQYCFVNGDKCIILKQGVDIEDPGGRERKVISQISVLPQFSLNLKN
jgi:hypothetical protein